MLTKTDEYFITIAKAGNLNRAARILFVSQPSLTKYIQRLEQRLGAELFDHNATPIHLNETGEAYLKFLLETKERELLFLSQINEIQHMERGIIRFGIPPYCGQCYLPNILPTFSRRYPHVKINLLEKSGSALETALINQEIDLAVVHYPVTNLYLAYSKLLHEKILMVTKKDPTKFGITAADIEEFKDRQFILPQSDQKIGKIVDRFLGRCSFIPNIYIRTRSVETTLLLAAQGLGVGFVPESGLQSLSSKIDTKVSYFSVSPQLNKWCILGVTRKNYKLRNFEKYFFNLLKEYQHKQ